MQPTNYPFNPRFFGPVAFGGDYVVLQPSSDPAQWVYGEVLGYNIDPSNEVNFGAVTNGTESTPAQALTSSQDQLAVGLAEFVQGRFKLDTRDFAGAAPGSDAVVKLWQPGGGSNSWQTANAVYSFAPSQQIDWGAYSHWTEFYYQGTTTPFFSVKNQTSGTLTNTRIVFSLIHYWFRRFGAGPANRPPDVDTPLNTGAVRKGVRSTPSGQIIPIPLAAFAGTGTSPGSTNQ